jgi:hypothetical protein
MASLVLKMSVSLAAADWGETTIAAGDLAGARDRASSPTAAMTPARTEL